MRTASEPLRERRGQKRQSWSAPGFLGCTYVFERPKISGACLVQAGVELLDRKMATLRQDISERAASDAKDFKVRT